MIFDKGTGEFLDGVAFSSGRSVKMSGDNPPGNRIERILQIVGAATVIHVGCADHKPLIKEKIASKTWLHGRLQGVCARLIGLDIAADAIAYIRGLGVPDVYSHDVTSEHVLPQVREEAWEFMVLGEIVEHLDNPVSFLSAIRRRYSPFVRKMLVTAPNACRYANFRNCLRGVEFINTDHRFWFTPYTLAKILHRSGMGVTDFYYVNAWEPSSRAKRWMYDRFPQLKDTLIMIAEFPS